MPIEQTIDEMIAEKQGGQTIDEMIAEKQTVAVLEPVEPNAFEFLNDPNDIEIRTKDAVDMADRYEIPVMTALQLYDPLIEALKNVTDPTDVELPELEPAEREQPRLEVWEPEKTRLEKFLGFKYPPKPPGWEYASPIEKFHFITMPIGDFLGRIGGKIASDWRITTKEEAKKTLAGELAEDLKWYQKSPEAIGWTAEKVAEYIAIKAFFKLSGLHRVLSTAGQKAARPFMSKEIVARGGIQKVSTLSVTGLRNMGRQALQSFLAAAPENAAFIATWSGLDTYMKGGSSKEIATETVRGAGWGLALTAGLAALGPVVGAPEVRLAFRKAIYNLNKKYPKVMDLAGKKVQKEVLDNWIKFYNQSVGRDIRFIDLTKTQKARFRNAVRLAEKELVRAAKAEQAMRAYWAAETQKAAEAAKKAKPPPKPTPEAIEKVIEPVKTELEKMGVGAAEIAKIAKPPAEIAKITPEPPSKAITPETRAVEGKIKVFHGTRADIDTFKPLSHFGTQKAAERALESVKGKGKAKVISAELTIKNPLEVQDTVGVQEDVVDWVWQAEDKGVVTEKEATTIENILKEKGIEEAEPAFVKLLKSKGYDGLKYINKTEDKGSISYVVFDPKQVKITPPTPAKPTVEKPKPKIEKKFYTSVPEEWRRVEALYDWGKKGLRGRYMQPGRRAAIKAKDEMPRKTFVWQGEMGEIPVGNQKFLREVKKHTNEVWPVKIRRGKFWTTTHYLAPKQVIADVTAELGKPKLAKIKERMTMAEIIKEHEAKYEIIKKKSEEQGLLALSDEEFETFIAKEGFVPEEYKREAGFVAVPDFGVISDMYNRAHDWMITFGEAKRVHPELYDKLMKSYGQRGASVEKAIDEVGRIIEEPLSLEEDAELALTYEDKRLEPPEQIRDVYDKFSTLLDRLEKIQLKEGIFQRPFQERMIEENQVKIEKLATELKHPTQSKRIQALVAENVELKNMRYLSHSVVARRAIEAKVNRLKGDERKAFISRMSAIYRKRKGKLFLRDYLDSDLITKDDIRMTRLATQELADYYVRSSYKTLYDYGKAEGLIKPASSKLRAEGWLNQKELGIIAPELKEQLIHPLYGGALAELKAMRLREGGFGRQILSMTKIGQFIKPSIIWTYNAVQKYMKGMYSFNPVKESKLLSQATREVLSKSPLYHKLNADNLYQFPYEVSKGSREKQIDLFIRQNSKETSRLLKILERTTDMSWAPEDMDLGTLSKNMMIAAHKAVGQVTWTGDKIQRTQSYLILRTMGYPHDEAIKVASKSHGAYSVLSERYKKIASKALFVYSFRFLMPIEIGKILTEPVIGAVKAAVTGEKIPRYKIERWAKAWIGAVALPIMIDQYMKYRGFEKEGVHLGPLAWKWKKEITVEGEKSEIVVGMNYILNMPVKYAQRLMYHNPIRPEARTQQVLERVAKWEIHPLYRIFFWDINENRRSFGSGIEVYDTEASLPVQLGQIAKYVFGQSFRFWGGMMDAVGEGEMTEKERQEQEKIFDSALTDLDKFLFTVLGYKYTRRNLQGRQVIMAKYLKKELASRRFSIERKYEGEEKSRRIENLKKWAEKCQHWILNDMK